VSHFLFYRLLACLVLVLYVAVDPKHVDLPLYMSPKAIGNHSA